VGSVKKVSDIVGEINAASDEQATGIEQINSAVTQMDKSTQQNAAMVEQAAAAAESMKDQARLLTELVSFFRVGEDAEAPRPAKAAKHAAPVPKETRAVRERAPAASAKDAAPSAASPKNGKKHSATEDGEWVQF
ncbi:MAG TPA: hypothetical protein VEQ58_18055, partial [Polyangiaceae bacterium]|nr:hypothetical protein [Polyangiaceae bacterium]